LIDPSLSDQAIAEIIFRVAAEIKHADGARRQTAIRDLSDLCRKVRVRARAAIPIWLELLADEDKEIGESASYGLSNSAPDSLEPLIDQLRHHNPIVRQRACSSFGTIGKEAIIAAHRILPLLADSIDRGQNDVARTSDYTRFRGATYWLAANTPAGARVFSTGAPMTR